MNRAWQFGAIAAGLGLIAVALVLWWQEKPPAPEQTPPAPRQPVAIAPSVPAPAASEPAILHPVVPPEPEQEAAGPLNVEAELTALFGRRAVLSMFQLGDFPRRFVATVDNLGRARAPAGVWPVNPVGGKFLVETRDGAESISADNGLRYTPYVLLLEAVDLRQVAAVYVRLYPLFQQAYVDLGFPRRYFNDRLIEVIDLLLATPSPEGPLGVHLPTINGPLQPERPWVLYEFDDPPLQTLAAGQKLLLRMGPVNERRVKARLAELRQLVAAGSTRR